MTPLDTVHAFIGHLERLDLEAGLELLADDVEYDNVPMRKVHGRDAVRESLAPFLAACTEVAWPIHHEAASGEVVMNERVDRFKMPHGWVELPVAGLFVVRDGRIVLWRDYFDLGTFTKAMTPG
jgi:limonene-1,2-epoxide hydrolase